MFQANAGLRRLSAREAYAGGGFEIVGKAVEYQQDAVAGVDIDAGPHLFGKAEMALTLFNGCWQRNEGKRFGSPKCLHGKAAHHGHKDSGLHGGGKWWGIRRDKKNQKLAGMSGGEKSLTALAFVFAIQKYLPSPFYAFDEVDMHLDGPNVERLAEIITNHAKTAQFIVVSLRKPMLDNADRMIGVTQ